VIHARAGERGSGKELGGKCKRILSRSMKHAVVRYPDISMDVCTCIYAHIPRAPTPRTLSRARYRARHNGIPRYINFGAHFSHRPSISFLMRAAGSRPFSRLRILSLSLSLSKCTYPSHPTVLFHPRPAPSVVLAPLRRGTRNRGTIPQTFSGKTKFHR